MIKQIKFKCSYCKASGLFVRNCKGSICCNCMGKGYEYRDFSFFNYFICIKNSFIVLLYSIFKPFRDMFLGLKKVSNCEEVAILINDTESKVLKYKKFYKEYRKK